MGQSAEGCRVVLPGRVVRAIDACSKAGFRDVQIAIRKAEAKE